MAPEIYAIIAVLIATAIGYVILGRDRASKALPGPKSELPPASGDEPVSEGPTAERALRAAQNQLRPDQATRYHDGLAKTRQGFVAKLAGLFRGKPRVDDNLRDQIEEILFTADIGTQTAQKLFDRVAAALDKDDVANIDVVLAAIREGALELLREPPVQTQPTHDSGSPYVVLIIGVNGVGKTTTLGKIAAVHARAGKRVLLVAGDTFRAAAVRAVERVGRAGWVRSPPG